VTPDALRTLQALSQLPRTTAAFTGPGTKSRTDLSLSAPDTQQKKVSAAPHTIIVSKDEFEKLKIQLEQSSPSVATAKYKKNYKQPNKNPYLKIYY